MHKHNTSRGTARRRGYVLITMACVGFGLMGAVGLAVDMGRLFTIKTETQAYADAAALAAAMKLDGASTGITAAKTAVTNSKNTWNFNTTTVPAATVEFATSLAGPWSTNPGSPAGYVYARVTATVAAPLAFMPAIMSPSTRKFKQNVQSRAVAAQIGINKFPVGAAPYTAVSTDTTGPKFGLNVGTSYDIQWPQYNGTKKNCSNGHPENCFNSPPCAGDLANIQTMQAVSQNWGSNINGYWGFSSNADIKYSVLDGKQTTPVSVGDNILPVMSNGNKAAEGPILDLRVNEDPSYSSNTPSTYLADNTHNGRRLMVVPIVNPVSTTVTTVIGFGTFLLYDNGTSASSSYKDVNGNDPYCAVYVGPYVLNGDNPGGATGGTGAYRVKLVE